MRRARTAWVVAAILLAAYVVLGFWGSANAGVVGPMAKWGIVAACISPILFIVVYTVIGLTRTGKKGRWWGNDLGVTLVWAEIAILAQSGPLAWAFLLHHGQLTGPLAAWIYLGGLIASPLIIAWRAVVFIRIWLEGRRQHHP